MINIKDLLDEIEKDNDINQTNLEGEIARCLSLSVKYLRYHRHFKETLIRMWGRLNTATVEKQEYYAGRASSDVYRRDPFNLEVKNAPELKRWLDGDVELVKMREAVQLTEDTITKIEGMIESLKYRPNHIQTILEIRRFEAGG